LITRPSAGRPNGNQNRFLRVTKDHISSGGHHGASKRNGVVACSPSHALDRRRAGMGLQEAAFPSFCCAPAFANVRANHMHQKIRSANEQVHFLKAAHRE
jgi:hypothetical protein